MEVTRTKEKKLKTAYCREEDLLLEINAPP